MKHLVLVGGGHAHVQVLRDFAAAPLAAARITLVSPDPQLVYSGMVPGHLAGHYAFDDIAIALGPLAAGAKADFVQASATALDAAARVLTLSTGDTLRYDALSLDSGGVVDADAIPGAHEHALPVRPMRRFVQQAAELIERAPAGPLAIVIVGGGAGGVELAMALQHRLAAQARVSLVTGGPPPLASHAAGAQARVRRALRRRGITLFEDSVERIAEGHVVLARHGGRLACDAAIVATGTSAPQWLRDGGLALDEHGFVATSPTLQSMSHAEVFAAGDVASRPDAPHPKSGVFAVRAGPPLALNLRRFVGGGELQPHVPQKRSLNLLSCGERYAIASWGRWSAEGRWVWWWKDRIDRAFVRGFRDRAAGRR
ncbi:FAD-dependent oxidoreductase [Piscinibacter sp. XHJ-5]|uniref:FAD-dependent oxidoreductase n=1 Tax=Piscinibacter sp. XHJ-5 TaxID=3037797 RepID=UPI0024532345|nr:FAD-dependent oxidoreductase [Piscinibacter sp. XHJ-5]